MLLLKWKASKIEFAITNFRLLCGNFIPLLLVKKRAVSTETFFFLEKNSSFDFYVSVLKIAYSEKVSSLARAKHHISFHLAPVL